ncbi:glycosyltransferase family 9 protein [Massilia glaciei]|uniref:Glycosyltransferase family 9 protein n=1 Tax=Massilia glaciei TaxID=1524097 RepID=A0A2U2HHN4_9BURK|nr:glycosyltransferase family 9 protein [Massilia glaciei]PWF45399.1 glycosyltransferase family 9 protein [Massilia glaciei]
MSAVLPGVKKIAVLRPNAVGDFVFALPALHALRASYPGADIVYIGRRWHADFLAGRPGPVDRVVVIPPVPGVGVAADAKVDGDAVDAFVAAMVAERFDLAIQAFGGGRFSNPFIMRLGARRTVGLQVAGAGDLDLTVPYGSMCNSRLQLLEVAACAGARAWHFGRPELAVTDADRLAAAQVLPAALPKPLVLLQPGATDPRRRWPAARFAELGDALAGAGALVAINGSEDEAPLVHAVASAMRAPSIDLAGKLALGGLCGVLERCALLVSNDTGPLHLALAVGTPGVGIYWLTNLIESGPLRQHGHRAAVSVRLHCPVCGAENLSTRCAHDVSFVDDVGTARVRACALELMQAMEGINCCVASGIVP